VLLLLGAVVYLLYIVHDIDTKYVTYKHFYDELKIIDKGLGNFTKEVIKTLAASIGDVNNTTKKDKKKDN